MDDSGHLRGPNENHYVALIVDDERCVLNIVRTLLQREGFSTLVGEDGEEALRISRRYAGKIELLVTDVIMPGLDGFKLRNKIVTERPEIKVLLMSGTHPPKGDIPFLRKPFTIGELRNLINQLLSPTLQK